MTSFYEELRKSDAISDEKENAHSRASIDKWIFRLLLFLIGFMPLIVMANVEQVISPLVSNIDVLSSGTKGDLFTHYKALVVVIITAITGAMLLAKVFFMGGTIRKTYLNYVLGVFVVAIVVSTIASPNISIALNGQYNRSDGAISWLCYVALLFIAMNIEYPKNVVKYIMYTMMPFVFINLFIIMMNFYGKDLLQYSGGQKIVSMALPEGASISAGSTLVGTLNQWNYMSGMFAMMTVMYLGWSVTSEKWVENIIGSITASVAITVMFMSLSTSGFLTVVVLFPLILVAAFRVEKKIHAFSVLVVFLVITSIIFNVFAEKNPQVWSESFGIFTDSNPYIEESIALLEFESRAYASDIIFELPALPERSIAAGSGRIYIWDKTLDLVKESPILGYGSDSLIYNFPHYNIDSRVGMWDENTITDKSHNMYVSSLFGFGILGFIALLLILANVGVTSLKVVFEKRWKSFVLALTGLAYFAQAMFNDSLPATSAVAFIVVGMMLTLDLNEKQEEHI